MLQIVYASRPLDFSAPSLLNLLLTARQFNTSNNITGALLYRDDIFMQMLEGDSAVIRNLMKRISKDERHTIVVPLVDRSVASRAFSRWEMYSDPFDDDLFSRAAVRDRKYLEMPTAEILALFTRLSHKPLQSV